MDKEHAKGAAKKAEGSVKETAGKMTDNKKLEAEGEARKTAGDVKDAVKD